MKVKSTLTTQSGQVLDIIYNDIDSEFDIVNKKIHGVHAYCFFGEKLVLVYSAKKDSWSPPGGRVEEGEGVQRAVEREVAEETNMRVVKQRIIGCQNIIGSDGVMSQVRSVCIVEPYGTFVNDPDGEITKIECIDPKEYKKYFDWGDIGDRVMYRALELKEEISLER